MAVNSSTISGLNGLFRGPVSDRRGLEERRAFARRIPTVLVMVDEITGDGAGARCIHALSEWLDQQFLSPFGDAPCFKVVLVISDASLGNEVVLDRYLNSGARAPDKVLIAPSAGMCEFNLAATRVKLGRRKHDMLHIMTNSYPASKLIVDYRVRLSIVKPAQARDGRPQSFRHAIVEQVGEKLTDSIVAEVMRALEADASQIIVFVQDKAFLRDIRTRLYKLGSEEQRTLRDDQVAILDSSVLSAERARLISPGRRDSIKIFLMTSSGSRGVSFPKADWIIAMIPRFGIEAALMEVAQLIYRGRGEHYTDDAGHICTDGDWKNRHLVMLLNDYLSQTDETPEPRQWMRQVTDLMTYLVMLRSTIRTRITGDAGLDRQQLAFVPVGGIGTDDMLSLMSTQVRNFLKESDVFMRDSSGDPGYRDLVKSAQKAAVTLFSKFSLEANGKQGCLRTVVRVEDIERFSAVASAENAPLLPDPDISPEAVIPEHLYCVGPFWLEHWKDLDKEERYNVEGWLTDIDNERQRLANALYRIHMTQELPTPLRRPAEELFHILSRKSDEVLREFSTVKSLEADSTWIAVPVDYARFWRPGPDGRYPSLLEQDTWRDALASCLGGAAEVLPVIARYAGFPYAAIVGAADPARLDLVFDDRYLAASNELNLLNTVLLEQGSESQSVP